MSWRGRKGNECEIITFCDFGEEGRQTEIGRHRDKGTAARQLVRIAKIYTGIHGWRCWQVPFKEQQDD